MEGHQNFEKSKTNSDENGFDILTEVEFAGAKEEQERAIDASEQYLDEMDDAYYEFQNEEKIRNYNSEHQDDMHDEYRHEQGLDEVPTASERTNEDIQKQWDDLEQEMDNAYVEYDAQRKDEEELQKHLEKMEDGQDDFSGERNINDKTGKERSFSEMDLYARRKGQTSREYGSEMSRRHDLTLLTELFPKNAYENAREYSYFITKIHDLMPRNEGESPDKYTERLQRVFRINNEQTKNKAPNEKQGAKNTTSEETAEQFEEKSMNTGEESSKNYDYEWKKVLQGSDEMKKLEKDESVLVFLTSSDGGFAVKKSEAVDSFIERSKNAKTMNEFFDAQMLANNISGGQNGFSEEEIKKKNEYMQSPEYQKKVCFFNVEREKKNIERKNDTLKRCEEVLAKERKGGFFKRLFNGRAIREAQEKVEWTKRGIEESQETLLYYSNKLKAFDNPDANVDPIEYIKEKKAA